MYAIRRLLPILLLILALPFVISTATYAVNGSDQVVILLDPGHGGRDPGAVNGTTYERENTLKLALALRDQLEAHGGFAVYLTREDNNTYLTLQQRAAIADRINADVCISLHFNSTTSTSASGAEVCVSVKEKYCLDGLGRRITANLSARLGIENDGLRRQAAGGSYWSEEDNWDLPYDMGQGASDYYGLINWCSKYAVPALIVEHCYISNPSEVQLIQSSWALNQMAKADAEAIISYFTDHTHTYGAVEVDYPVSCISAGEQSNHCTKCAARAYVRPIASEVDANGHLWYQVDGKKATCGEEGYRTYYCAYAHDLILEGVSMQEHVKKDTLEALSHDYLLTETVEPHHVTDGYRAYTCVNCWHTVKEILPATEEHEYQLVETVEPTCIEYGSLVYRCDVCDDSYTEPTLPTGIHHLEVIQTVEPTCIRQGRTVYACSQCGEEVDQPIPPTEQHHYVSNIIEPATCEKEGLRADLCSSCGKRIETTIPTVEHDFHEGICRICGLHSGTASTISPPTSTPVTSAPEPEQEDSSGESLPPNPIDPEPPQKESGFLMPFLAGVLCGGGLVGAILGIAFAMSRAPQENDEGD